tara:strand:+ start:213 stop:737 length:525 start_codon:yes stop_codon:yes gene_type:complete
MAQSDRNKHRVGLRKVVRVTPTLDTDAIGYYELMHNSFEIPDAVAHNGSCSKLLGFGVVDYSDQLDTSIWLHFTTNQQNFGSVNNLPSISDSDLRSAGYLGFMHLNAAKAVHYNMDNIRSRAAFDSLAGNEEAAEVFLQAATNSTSVYFTTLITNSSPTTWAADDLEFWFLIEY